jgi:UDP-GlcNAc:undecaprenyl-phosphate GlcNAc-1-phosphate transferase
MAWPRRANYLGEDIPTAAGVVFLAVPLMVVLLRLAGAPAAVSYNERVVTSFVFLITTLGLLGLLDDIFGGHQAKGFKGHIAALFQGRITTGLIKAAGGGLAALAAAWYIAFTPFSWEILFNGLLIALAVNTLNLLDLRPGRALKALFIAMLLLWLCSLGAWLWTSPVLWAFIVIALGLFPFDLRAKIMLGDAGSNVLGGIVGLTAVVALGPVTKIIAFIVFLALNVISERWSFTQIIEAIPPLKWLDEAGRAH